MLKQDLYSLTGMYCSHTVTFDGESIYRSLRFRPDLLATLLVNLFSLGTLHGGVLLLPVFQLVSSHSHRSSAVVKSVLSKTHGLRQQVRFILLTFGSYPYSQSTSSLSCTGKIDPIIVNSIRTEIYSVEREHRGLLKSSMPCLGY